MRLGKAWENRDYFSGKASEATRQLSFSGVAVVWIFKSVTPGTPQVPADLVLPLFLLVLALALDFGQYITGSIEWEYFVRTQERKHTVTDEDDPIDDAPAGLNAVHTCCFWAKLVALLGGYVFLVSAMASRL